MSRRGLAHRGAPCDGANHLPFQFHGHGRGRGARQLRIEQAGDAVGALRRKGGAGVEQPEIARVRHLDDAVLHALDGPGEQLLERPRLVEIVSLELGAKGGHVDGGDNGARLEAQQRLLQLAGQPLLDAPALRRFREQSRDRVRQRRVVHRRRLPP
jgi:hypothetical protein